LMPDVGMRNDKQAGSASDAVSHEGMSNIRSWQRLQMSWDL
jgi:hypothetical protein